ncbi:hypothetical protein ACFS5L_42890 [Streptomyces phyllanthi]|nr:hypothetical protein [Streptomyces phyllanthi]
MRCAEPAATRLPVKAAQAAERTCFPGLLGGRGVWPALRPVVRG